MFIGGTDAEAETPILWPPNMKSWLIWKDPDTGKDWVREDKWTTEDEMVGWHYRHNGHGFGWTPKVGDGQGGLACCTSWGCKESDMTEWLNWIELNLSQASWLMMSQSIPHIEKNSLEKYEEWWMVGFSKESANWSPCGLLLVFCKSRCIGTQTILFVDILPVDDFAPPG